MAFIENKPRGFVMEGILPNCPTNKIGDKIHSLFQKSRDSHAQYLVLKMMYYNLSLIHYRSATSSTHRFQKVFLLIITPKSSPCKHYKHSTNAVALLLLLFTI